MKNNNWVRLHIVIVLLSSVTFGQTCTNTPPYTTNVIYVSCPAQGCADIGASINAAIKQFPPYTLQGGYCGGAIVLPPGIHNLKTTVNTNSPNIQIVGAGSNSTIINCYVGSLDAPQDCINTQIHPKTLGSGFMIGGFSIIGVDSTGKAPSTTANAAGLHAGDMIGGDFFDMQIDGFAGTNSACLLIDNEANWFENDHFRRIDLGIHGGSGTPSGCTNDIRTTRGGKGTASLEGTSFTSLFMQVSNVGMDVEETAAPSYMEGKANVAANGVTVFNMLSSSETDFEFLVDFSNGTGALWNVPAGVGVDYTGHIVTVNPAASSSTISGTLNHHLTYMYESPFSFGSPESASSPANGTTYSTSSHYGVPGAYLQRNEGGPNGYQQGVGFNLFFDPSAAEWKTGTDLSNSGGGGVYLNQGGDSPLTFYTVPSTGGVDQTIPNSSFSNYKRAVLNSSGLTVYGNLFVTGTKNFIIDHPLAPENKYLYHAAVESSEMKNIYDGVVDLNEKGQAEVQLPDWFEALNKDFRYQLSCIGNFAPVYVAEQIHENRFRIAGGSPGLKVSWQVTGIRHDPHATAHPFAVEADKPKSEQGTTLTPGASK